MKKKVEPLHQVQQTIECYFDNNDTIIEYVLNEPISNKRQ